MRRGGKAFLLRELSNNQNQQFFDSIGEEIGKKTDTHTEREGETRTSLGATYPTPLGR